MTPSRKRVLVLGVDAANPALLSEWAADGTLPNIAALIARGRSAASESLEGFYEGSTWPSLYTGVSPAKHGVHFLWQVKPGTYDYHHPSESAWVERESLWSALSRAGRRVTVLDVPLSRLDPSINGIQVVEWGGHDAIFGFGTHPSELGAKLTGRFGAHPAGLRCDADRRTADDYERFVGALERGAEIKGEITAGLLRDHEWDFAMQVFTESHCAGHQCWHLHDAAHPAHDAAIAGTTGDPLRRVYCAIDRAIGRALQESGAASVVLVVGHGMSHRFGASFLLEEILVRLGVTQRPAGARRKRAAYLEAENLEIAAARAWLALPGILRNALRPFKDALRPPAPPAPVVHRLGADPRTSMCFPVDNGLAVGGIRLNLKGREPDGLLEPGPAAEAFCDNLSHDLLAIVDDRDGDRLVQRVLRTSSLYAGERLASLPDLLVEWNDHVPTGSSALGTGRGSVVRAHSAKVGVVEGVNDYGRSGEHRRRGLLVVAGHGLQPGRSDRVVSVLDIAPTLAAMFGVSMPDVDGRVLEEFLPSD